MCPLRFEPAFPAGERPQTCPLHRAATGIGIALGLGPITFVDNVPLKNVSTVLVLRRYHARNCYYLCKHFLKQHVSFFLDFSAVVTLALF